VTGGPVHSLERARLAVLALWVGAVAFFLLAGAGIVFEQIGDRNLAGLVNGELLGALNVFEGICWALLILFTVEGFRNRRGTRRWVRLVGAVVMGVLLAVYSLGLGPRMERLRSGVPDFNVPAEQDATPQRALFARDHALYMALLGVNLLLGLGLLVEGIVREP